MSNKVIGKIIGYGVAGVLTIGGASVIITHDDIAEQYKINTGKELTIDERELISFEEALESEKLERSELQSLYNETDCSEYEDYYTCSLIKATLQNLIIGYDNSIDCDTRIVTKNSIEKLDLMFCINSQKQLKSAMENFYVSIYGSCDSECQEDLDAYDYNVAMFQAYLNKID